MTDEPKPTWREQGVNGLPSNVGFVEGEGSRGFVEIEGWTVKPSQSEHLQGGIQNQLCERYLWEGNVPFQMVKLLIYGLGVHAIQNPDRYYHMVHYRQVYYPPRESFTPVIQE